MKIELLGRVHFPESLQSCAQVHLYGPSNENTGCSSSCGQRTGKARKFASMASDESQEQKKRSLKRHRKKDSSVFHTKRCAISKTRSWNICSRSTKDVVVLQCGIVKVDSGSYAAFTKHGPSSQMNAAKVIGVRVRPHTADAVSACTQVRVSRFLDTSTTTQKWPKAWPNIRRTSGFLLSEICMATPLPHCWHNSKQFYWTWMEEKYRTESA